MYLDVYCRDDEHIMRLLAVTVVVQFCELHHWWENTLRRFNAMRLKAIFIFHVGAHATQWHLRCSKENIKQCVW